MKKFKVSILSICLVVIALLITIAFGFKSKVTEASALSTNDNSKASLSNSARGLFTNLTISVDGGNGIVFAKASNDLTILPSKVEVHIYLYSCYTYRDSYTEMVLVQQDYISDLNMGKSITVSASTNGEQKYWKARMRYKVDKKDWKEESTKTYLFDSNGVLIS